MVEYVDADTAWQEGLVIVQGSSVDKNTTSAIMKVDNYTYLAEGQKRRSVRLSSKQAFKYGLVVLDVIKLPFGCSVWPAFWTVGENWPHGGEIDIVEGVNMGSVNQMTLHSGPGCQVAETMGRNATGKVLHQDCDATGTGNVGCGVADNKRGTLGANMNEGGGGVFVMEWTRVGISVWRFGRHEIPTDLATGNDPRPASWRVAPIAHWAHQQCTALDQRFSPHKIIFDITLCGDWAGASDVFTANGLCNGSCSSVVKDPAVFKDAYWEIASVKLYQ
ncbi:hypothetical protein VP01_132g16 [Puccinia sorghi]|uniref:GH16 domain-containing protein n=1 Tax=Puccinia sorghi TaxID=27349 RepID=A0A0L6VMI1_9BASI|nr:hypothetical protein VP01_132g16 [Puccinia sorghi]